MRLALYVAAWLSLTLPAATFTVPHAQARFPRTSLAASGDDLVAAYTRKSAAKIVEQIVETTTPMPPPPIPPTQDVIEASELTIPSIPTSFEEKLTAVQEPIVTTLKDSSSTNPIDKAPSLVEWISGKGSEYREAAKALRTSESRLVAPPLSGDSFDRVTNLKEKLAIIKQNVIGGFSDMASDNPTEKVKAFKLSSLGLPHLTDQAAAGAAAVSSVGLDWNEIMARFHVEEYSTVYSLVAAILWGAFQRKAGRDEAEAKYEALLAKVEAKAFEASEAANVATTGAKIVEKMVYKADTRTNIDVLEKTKRQAMEVEMETLKKNIEKLKQEASTLKKDLEKANAQSAKISSLPAPAPGPPPAIPSEAPSEQPQPYFAEVETPVVHAEKPPKGAKKSVKGAENVVKKVTKAKKVVAEDGPDSRINGANPWAELSPSTLKRKSVKELAAYLSERGISTTDADGKALKKAELLNAVVAL